MNKGKYFINKVFDNFCNIIFYLCFGFLLIQILVLIYVVFGRYILRSTPRWGEQLALLCMVWFSLLSASLAVKENRHIKLTFINDILPLKIKKILEYIFFILKFLFALFMLLAGTELVILTLGSTIPGLGISTSWKYLAVPVTGLSLILMLIASILLSK